MTLLDDFGKALLGLKAALQKNNYLPEFKITISPDIMLKLLSDMDAAYKLLYEDSPRYNPLEYSLFGIRIESPRLNEQHKYPVLGEDGKVSILKLGEKK